MAAMKRKRGKSGRMFAGWSRIWWDMRGVSARRERER